jgi:hypothetical protein
MKFAFLILVLAIAGSASRDLIAGSASQDPAYAQTDVRRAGSAEGGPAAFDFPDDDDYAAPTWSDDLRAQAVDLALVGGFITLALVGFVRKSEPMKMATLAAAVGYLGFYKSDLVSIVNVFGLVGGNLPIFRYNLAWYLLAGTALVTTVLWGRVYCGRMCAFGALTQLIDRVVPARWQVKVPRAWERRAGYVKYGILAAVVTYFVVTKDPLIYPYVEPFWLFGFHGTPVLWTALAALLVATVFVRNLYCRFLCPVGAFLGLLSNLTVFRIRRWNECSTCRICEKACEWGAIRGPRIVLSECVRCDDCERLYADTRKCPHHLILIRRQDILRRREQESGGRNQVPRYLDPSGAHRESSPAPGA